MKITHTCEKVNHTYIISVKHTCDSRYAYILAIYTYHTYDS